MNTFKFFFMATLTCLAFAAQLAAQTVSSAVDFTSSNLPIIVIDTHGQTIPDEPKITADLGIIYNGPGVRNNLTDPFNHYNGKIGIEVRGSSSQSFPKKQFGIETRDTLGADLDVSLLDLPKESDWVLSASYSDKTLMRNVLAYKLANDLGRYASRTRYCEVVLNGDYRGVYVLMEKVKRDKNRVNVTKINATDVAGDAVTGGYIFKIDKLAGSSTEGWYSAHLPYSGAWQQIYYQYDYPKQEDIAPEQRAYLKNYVRAFEDLMTRPDYADPQTGYSRVLDVDSFVDYFLLQEIARNVDGYRLSAFMHKDRDSKNPKLKMGPLWDFDLAFGNADYYDGAKIAGWQVEFQVRSDAFQLPFWWPKLMQDSSFVYLLKPRWQQLRNDVLAVARVHAVIDSLANHIDEAQARNFQRWPILGTYVWPNAYIGQTYADELNYLKHWLELRILWMDARMPGRGGTSAEDPAHSVPNDFTLAQNYPNPLNPTTTIAFQLARAALVSLKIFDVSGREIMALVEGELPSGEHERSLHADALASGVYFYRLQVGDHVASKKLLIVGR